MNQALRYCNDEGGSNDASEESRRAHGASRSHQTCQDGGLTAGGRLEDSARVAEPELGKSSSCSLSSRRDERF
jgi:hypothetical protein